MKMELAIEVLKELWRYEHTDKYTEAETREALDMAIKALSADGDLISKKEVLDTICSYGTELERLGIYQITVCNMKQRLCDLIEELPTIPQTTIKNLGVMECPKCGTLFYEVPTIETVLEDIKDEIQGLIDFEESCCGDTTLGYQCLGVIEDRISELKGENKE